MAVCASTTPNALGIINANTANLPNSCANQATLNRLLSDLFVVLGAIAVLMIVIAGLRYVLARGNPEKMAQARNIILYSVIGLILSSLAYAIVSFVITNSS